MIVRSGTPFSPNDSPLVPTRIRTIEGRERFGGAHPTGGAGVLGGGRYPIGLTAANVVRRRGRGVRGLGANYCKANPPDAVTQKMITDAGGTVNLIDCAYSTGGQTPSAGFVNNGNAMVGSQPAQNLPAQPNYEQCQPLDSACAARNGASQVAWQNAYFVAQADYQRALCLWNGVDPATCNQRYPPGAMGSMAVQAAAPPVTAQPAAPVVYNPRLAFGPSTSLKVGDTWTLSISGAAPNAPVTVSMTGPKTTAGGVGSTDATGAFSMSGPVTTDMIGSWSEVWSVAAQPVGTITFSVAAPAANGGGGGTSSSSGSGSGGSGSGGSGSTSSGGGPVVTATPSTTFDIGTFFTGSAFAGIPNWALIGAALAAVFVFGGHR